MNNTPAINNQQNNLPSVSAVCKNLPINFTPLRAKEIIEKLPAAYQSFVEARYLFPRVIDVPEITAKNSIKDLLIQLIASGNYKKYSNEASIMFLRDELHKDLKKRWNTFTLQEVKEAFENGIRGEYETKTGKLIGLNIENFNKWLRCYREDLIRTEAIKKFCMPEKDDFVQTPEMIQAGIDLLKKTHVEPINKKEIEERKQKTINSFSNHTSFFKSDPAHRWMAQFDKIHLIQRFTVANIRVICRYNKTMSIEEFLKYKLGQHQRIKTELLIRNQ